ncbi:DNA-binding transcriptional regulator, LysR family [Anaerosphaera aminiphila DSM 21120]|uniref:DNA-binding transcriptional regulator, LysR family n=1 Tax=Anaerosphaera aminiphila DSM 21120 TaxID=1120995 RepID=A0A1M5PRX1_9FIRM|nr:LysR family transcriptional regulator [Anaerosphaera aminiphila]SHH04512.1 DNA-binding transcriptional regulator, LysR family [Anaerosphaera aminiphila DSM 21120]
MNKSYELFLIAAEELNFTKAAKKTYVTQQCMSDHIMRLEKKLNSQLFVRKPSLSLTPQGEALVKTIKQMEILETNLENELLELNKEDMGSFSFGINTTRARILIPEVIPEYRKSFPNVDISIILNETQTMEKMVIDGSLDCFLGVNTNLHKSLNITPIGTDAVYLIISVGTLKACFKENYIDFINKSKYGVNLENFKDIPFTLNLAYSTTTEVFNKYLIENKIILANNISISDYDTQFLMCKKSSTATISPELILQRIIESNKYSPEDSFLCAFPINTLETNLELSFVTNVDYKMTKFLKVFFEILKNEIDILHNKKGKYIVPNYIK